MVLHKTIVYNVAQEDISQMTDVLNVIILVKHAETQVISAHHAEIICFLMVLNAYLLVEMEGINTKEDAGIVIQHVKLAMVFLINNVYLVDQENI